MSLGKREDDAGECIVLVRRRQDFSSEVNVTSLVDVSLTLLIIFMLVAPMMKHGIDIELPTVSASGVDLKNQVVITIDSEKRIYLGERRISPTALVRYLEETSTRNIFLKADKSIPYGFVMEIMGKIKSAGIENIGMITEPR